MNMNISLGWALLAWLVIAILTYIISRKSYIAAWESIILAILFGYIFMMTFAPFGSIYDRENPWLVIYLLITVISPLILAVFIIRSALSARLQTNNLFYQK